MRTLTTAQLQQLGSLERSVQLRVQVANSGGTLVDLTDLMGADWVIGAEWGETIDDPGQTATISLQRSRCYDSLNPLMVSGRLASAIKVGRAVVISVAVLPLGVAPGGSDWIEVFRGGIDTVDAAAEPMVLTCADNIRVLRDTWIEAPAAYSATPTAVETIMQAILADNMASPPTIYVPTSPGWMINEFQTELQSLLSQLTMLVDQIGWNLRYRWDSGTSAYRLTFYEPDRGNTTPDFSFGPGTVLEWQTLTVDIADIRNVVSITFGDRSNLDSSGQPSPTTVTEENAGSIAAYGRRWMGITEAATSMISTSAEATAMAAACLNDLMEPLAAVVVQVPFFPAVELEDLYTLEADNYNLDADTDFAVVGYRHTLSDRQMRTTLTLRGASPVGSHNRWLWKAAAPGIGALQDTLAPPDVPLTIVESLGHLQAETPAAWSHSTVEFHVVPPGGVVDESFGSTTIVDVGDIYARKHLVADFTNIPVGELVDVVAIRVDRRGNRSAHRRSSNKRTGRLGTHFLDPIQRVAGSFLGSTFDKQSRGSSYPPDGWHMAVGAWNTDAKQGDGTPGVDPLTGLYNLLLSNTSVATELYSDAFPVTTGRRYLASITVYAEVDTVELLIEVEWLDSALSVISSDEIFAGNPAASAVWFTPFAQLAPPSGARRARWRVAKDTDATYVQIDRVIWEEAVQRQAEFTGISLVDDFVSGDMTSRIGDLGWQLVYIGGDPSSVDESTLDQKPQTSWTESGVLRVGTPKAGGVALTNYGTILHLGEIDATQGPFVGLPPLGVECRFKATITTITSLNAWAGLWSNVSTYPGGASITGVGWKLKDDSGTLRWWGLCSNAGTETTTVAAQADAGDFVELGWRRTATGFMFMVNGVDMEEVTTNLPGGSDLLAPIFGVRATSASERWILVDWFRLEGQFQRMPT